MVAVDTDRLFYPADMAALVEKLPGAGPWVVTVHSRHGHDGFLVENDQVTKILGDSGGLIASDRSSAEVSPDARLKRTKWKHERLGR